ncbi:MAG: McrB family protein [Bacteroidota bacterium]
MAELTPWIDNYKNLISGSMPHLKYNELYKWETIQHFQDNWNNKHTAENIRENLTRSFNSKTNNLWSGRNYLPYSTILDYTEKVPEDVSTMFHDLYNEEIDVYERMQKFQNRAAQIMDMLYPEENWTHYQSDRAIMVYLVLRYPNKYYLYKNNMFNQFCINTNFRAKPGRGKKNDFTILKEYAHICDQIKAILKSDRELLEKHHSRIPSNITLDDDYNILTQDFIYAVATYLNQSKKHKYTFNEFKELFEEYLQRVVPDSARNYLSGLSMIEIMALDNNLIDESIYELQAQEKFQSFLNQLKKIKEFNTNNKDKHDKLSSALAKYENFLNEANKTKIESKKPLLPPLNQILYGPPGTGKTYNTVNKAIEIINGGGYIKYNNREQVLAEFERLKGLGQIDFVTFHQSFTYEDFIEGIKPKMLDEQHVNETTEDGDIKYEIRDGVFKRICKKAQGVSTKGETKQSSIDFDTARFFKMSIGGKQNPHIHDWCIENNKIALGWGGDQDYSDFLSIIPNWKKFIVKFKQDLPELYQASAYHAQAMHLFLRMKKGDTVLVSKGNKIIDAVGIISSDKYIYDDTQDFGFYQFREVDWIGTNLNASPDLFVRKNISQQAIYEFYQKDIKREYFKKEFSTVKKESRQDKHVLIIDEINRGNVAAIFGELITLIEDDKRLGKKNQLTVTLPYSGNDEEPFGVPSNLYIIGTMNTADRSVEALDTALRRRFSFVEIPPSPDLIKEYGTSEDGNVQGIDLIELLECLNKRIEILVDKDHMIGHSYFLKINTLDDLKFVFHNKIIPLLQEYFFGDFGKVGLVLGPGFVKKAQLDPTSDPFAVFDYEAQVLIEKPLYRINNVMEMGDQDFIKAVKTLMKH